MFLETNVLGILFLNCFEIVFTMLYTENVTDNLSLMVLNVFFWEMAPCVLPVLFPWQCSGGTK